MPASAVPIAARSYEAFARGEVEGRAKRARRDVEKRTTKARKRAERTAGRVAKTARVAADEPLAQADKLRRRAGVGSFPILGYDDLTASQVGARLADLRKPELRKVRTYEKNHKARKGVLSKIDAKLG